jgi:hypothetical protein
MSLGLVVACTAVIMLRKTRQSQSGEALIIILGEATARTKASVARIYAQRFMDIVVLLTGGWLSSIVYGFVQTITTPQTSNSTTLQHSVRATLQGFQHRLAPITLIAIVVAYISEWLAPAQLYWIRLFLVVQLIQTIARHLAYAVSPLSLPGGLRKSLGNVYFSFALITFSDVFIFILSINAAFVWTNDPDSLIQLSEIMNGAKGLVFVHTTEVLQKFMNHEHVPFYQLVQTGAGALFGINLLEAALRFHEFVRTDEDNLSIAQACCLLGRFNEALVALNLIKAPNQEFYMFRAIAYLGLIFPDRAWHAASRSLAFREEAPQSDQIFFELAALTMIFPSLSDDALRSLFDYALKMRVNDLILAYGLMSSSLNRNISIVLKDAFDSVESNQVVYCKIILLISAKQIDLARELLLKHVTSKSPAEKVLYAILTLLIGIGNERSSKTDNEIFFGKWSKVCIALLTKIDWHSLARTDLYIICGFIMTIQKISVNLGSPYQQSWVYFLDEVKRNLPVNSVAPRILAEVQKRL